MNGKADVRLGLLGAGAWGRNLLRTFHALGALAAFASIRAQSRAMVAGSYPGIEIYADPNVLFAAPGLDGVVIATPAATHGGLVAKALQAGKHVFVEKPLCLDVAEAERLSELASRRGVTLMVGHQLLYHPAFRALRSLVDAGAIGPLRYVYSHRLCPPRPWLRESALWGLAPHDVSMLLALSDAPPERVQAAASGVDHPPQGADGVVASLRFPDRLRAHLFASFFHPFKEQRLVAGGETGMVVFEDTTEDAGKLRLYRHRLDPTGRGRAPPKTAFEAVPFAADEPLRLACAAFVGAVRGEHRPLSDCAEAAGVVRVLAACERSLASGMPVDVKNGTG